MALGLHSTSYLDWLDDPRAMATAVALIEQINARKR